MSIIGDLLSGTARRVASNSLDQEGEMTFLDHVDVLRKHLVWSVVAILSCSILMFVYNTWLMDEVILGPKNPDFWTYRQLCKLGHWLGNADGLCITKETLDFKTVNTDISGQFTQSIWISFMAGLILAFPYILWQLWRFIKPALKPIEIKHASGIVFYCSMLFLTGVLFGYYMLTPVSISFLAGYKMSSQIENYIAIDSYISFVTSLTFGSGLVFEMPILVYFLSRIGLLRSTFMRKYRRHAVLVILILAAVVTPPDVTSMTLMSIPLYLLFELSILVAIRVERKRARE